jgi:microcystin-dependent protein
MKSVFSIGVALSLSIMSYLVGQDAPQDRVERVEKRIDSLSEKLEVQRGDVDRMAKQIAELKQQIPPIGSIVAFAGPSSLGPRDADGWMLCDGRILDSKNPIYAELLAAIGRVNGTGTSPATFRIPDFRGVFLRGASESGVPTLKYFEGERFSINGGASAGAGSLQESATARPKLAFQTSNSPDNLFADMTSIYTDDFKGRVLQAIVPDNQGTNIPAPGTFVGLEYRSYVHTHTITGGGDEETRPVNVAVNYYIRWK